MVVFNLKSSKKKEEKEKQISRKCNHQEVIHSVGPQNKIEHIIYFFSTSSSFPTSIIREQKKISFNALSFLRNYTRTFINATCK